MNKIENQEVHTNQNPAKELSLEDIIHLTNKIGMEYIEKRKIAERLELLRTSVRAKIMNRLEASSVEKIAEAKLKRLSEVDPEYMGMLEEIAFARAESEKAHIRYESYRNLFEARKAILALKRVELKTL